MIGSQPRISPDGRWYWDGAAWRPLSPDGGHAWTGTEWVPVAFDPYRTPPPQPRSRTWIWVLAGAGGLTAVVALGVVAILVISALTVGTISSPQRPATSSASGVVPCDQVEHLDGHYHVHLSILYNGQMRVVPEQVGIESDCIRWLHTHDKSGLIHVEIPRSETNRVFLLDDFFKVWDKPLSSTQVAELTGPVQVWIQPAGDKQPHKVELAPQTVALRPCESIFLVIGDSSVTGYRFPPAFGC